MAEIDVIYIEKALATPINISPHFSFLHDQENRLTPKELFRNPAAYPWAPINKQKVDFGFTPGSYWFLADIQYSGQQTQRWLLEIDAPLTDEITLFIQRSTGELTQLDSGDLKPFNDRPIKHRNFIFPIDLTAKDKIKIIIKAKDSDELRFNAMLWYPQSFWYKEQLTQLVLGVYYGVMLLLVFYNGFIYLMTRSRSFLLYILFVSCSTVFIAVQQGLAYQWLWPGAPYWHEKSDPVFAIATSLTAFIFLSDFLKLKHTRPLVHKILGLNVILLLVAMLMNFMLQHDLALRLTLLIVAPGLLISMYICVALGIRGQLDARLFASAWMFLGVGAIGQILNSMGVIPSNDLTDNSFLLGNTFHVFLQALALASRLKQIEADKIKALSMSEAKSEFLAKMSHEIRTPMNGVLGIVELMKDTGLNKQQQRYMDVINASGRSLLSIINDILDYSKIEAGRMELDESAFNIAKVIDEVTPLFSTYLHQQAINLNVYIASDIPEYVMGDSDRLRQVLINLLGNSFKFTQEGTITITVHPDASLPQHIYFAVSDSGYGISGSEQKKLFEAFYQSGNTQGASVQGTGLGLTICKQLVDLMGGEIGVKSEQGAGSTFWFSIPLRAANEAEIQAIQKDPFSKPAGQSLHVLVAEDNNTNQLIIRNLLNKLGHNVTIVSNGYQALAAIQQRGMDFDVILMDHEMPEMDGLTAARNIRNLASDYAKIPIIALTAHATAQERQRCFDAGMNDYLSKPVDFALLREKLDQCGSKND